MVLSPVTTVPWVFVADEDSVPVVTWTVLLWNVVPAKVVPLELFTVVVSTVPAVALM
jgi:hypothetical protein